MKNPLLSICIATYNRAEYIGETLESIISQLTDEVEIVIVDGASTDNTKFVVKKYIEICKQIRYILLSSKGGVDHDYCKTVEYARGKMCWLFPDDDLLRTNAIKAVLNELKHNYSLIIVNAKAMNNDFSRIIEDKKLKITKNEVYDKSKLELLFCRVIPYISFIGCVVINRNLWLHREKKSYFGTEFIHVGVIFQAPLPSPALVIAEPYIKIRLGNAQWSPRAFEIWMYKWPSLLCSFSNISKQVRQQYQPVYSWRRLKNIIIHRACKQYTIKEYQEWFAAENSALLWKIAVLIIAIIPSKLFKFAIMSYFRIFNREAVATWKFII